MCFKNVFHSNSSARNDDVSLLTNEAQQRRLVVSNRTVHDSILIYTVIKHLFIQFTCTFMLVTGNTTFQAAGDCSYINIF